MSLANYTEQSAKIRLLPTIHQYQNHTNVESSTINQPHYTTISSDGVGSMICVFGDMSINESMNQLRESSSP